MFRRRGPGRDTRVVEVQVQADVEHVREIRIVYLSQDVLGNGLKTTSTYFGHLVGLCLRCMAALNAYRAHAGP